MAVPPGKRGRRARRTPPPATTHASIRAGLCGRTTFLHQGSRAGSWPFSGQGWEPQLSTRGVPRPRQPHHTGLPSLAPAADSSMRATQYPLIWATFLPTRALARASDAVRAARGSGRARNCTRIPRAWRCWTARTTLRRRTNSVLSVPGWLVTNGDRHPHQRFGARNRAAGEHAQRAFVSRSFESWRLEHPSS
jgi:hypothetical protein